MRYFDGSVLQRPEKDLVVLEGPFEPSRTETVGYMPFSIQIERLKASGELYAHWKRGHFPPGVDVPDDFVPPDYAPDELDLIEEAKEVMRGKSRAAARKAVAEAKAAAPAGGGEIIPPPG